MIADRLIVIAKNRDFPSLSDGIKGRPANGTAVGRPKTVHLQDDTLAGVPQRPARPRNATAPAVAPFLEIATGILGLAVFSLLALFFLVL